MRLAMWLLECMHRPEGSGFAVVSVFAMYPSPVNRNRNEAAKMLPVQCKMARTALDLGIRELADANVSSNTVSRFEAGEELKPRTIASIRAALESAGVEFNDENGGGAGVRLRKAKGKRK